jgi:arylsulfatase A-like enzyme
MRQLLTPVWLAVAVVGLTAGRGGGQPPPKPPAPPNVVVILTDDQGWGDLSLNGNTNLRTPHTDSLAKGGARVERFFVQPVCSPTRAEFLTGRWHPRGGVRGVSTGAERLDLDEKTVADAFRAAGYATGCFGKWHNGSQYPYHPTGRGFAEYYGFTSGHWGDYYDPPLDHNGKAVTGTGFLADDLTDRAIAFLTANAAAGKPGFCYLALNTPHSPMQVPDKYWQRFEKADLKLRGERNEDLGHTRAALAMCENIDDNIGRLLAALAEKALDRNTVIVYFHDNGPNGPRWNGGMKGRKGGTDEGGVRSPLFVRWPAKIKPGTVVTPVAAAVDLYPTLIDLAGVKRAGDKPFDGVSLAPWLLGADKPAPDRVLFQHWNGKTSARSQRFRLDAAGQLFDIPADPGQQKDVAADHPAEAKRLADAVVGWKREVLGELPKADDRPFPVGHAEFPRAVLPARDGVPHGGVKRSANAPNCSFFTHWTKADDAMTWAVEVTTAGKYEATLHYTCPKADAGAAVELALGTAKWTGTIADPHDPPLRGQEHDRVPRQGESYVKDFKPLSLGVVDLTAGAGTLTLRATRVSGSRVADVRAVELVLVTGGR